MTRETKRKNYWPSLIVTLLWWGVVVLIMIMVDPSVVADFPLPGTYLIFFLFLFLAVWFTASLLLVNTRRGLLIAVGIIVLAYLRLWKVLSVFNFVLLLGMMAAFEYYFSEGKPKKIDSSDMDQ